MAMIEKESADENDLTKASSKASGDQRPKDWSAFLASDVRASEDYMNDVDDPPPQERDWEKLFSFSDDLDPTP